MKESKFLLVRKVTQVMITVMDQETGFIAVVAAVARSSLKVIYHFVLQVAVEVLQFIGIHQLIHTHAVRRHRLALTLELDKHHLKWAELEHVILAVVVDLKEMEQMEQLITVKEVTHS
jgi:hypothetical protein